MEWPAHLPLVGGGGVSHHAFHMHWGNLEIRCECIVEIDTVLGV